MSTIGTIDIELAANVIRIQKDMERVSRVVDQHMGGIRKAANMAQSALGAIGVGLSAAAIGSWIKSAVDMADQMGKLAARAGVSAEALSQWTYAASLSAVSQEEMWKAMSKVSTEAAKNNQAFAALGIATRDASGQIASADKILEGIAARIGAMPDGATKTALAVELLGKELGPKLIPLLNNGTDGLRRMREEALVFGRVVDDEAAAAAARFNDDLARMRGISSNLGMEMAKGILPGLTQITTAMTAAAREGGVLSAIWVGLGGLGAALFTDEFASNAEKLRGMQQELNNLERRRRESSGKGYLHFWLYGTPSELDAEIAAKKAQIASFVKANEAAAKAAEARKKAEAAAANAATEAEIKRIQALFAGTGAKQKATKAAKDLSQSWTESQFAALAAWHEYETLSEVLAEQAPLFEALAAAAERNNAAFGAAFDAQEQDRIAREDSIRSVREYMEALEFEHSLLGLTSEARTRAVAIRQLEAAGLRMTREELDKYIQRLDEMAAQKSVFDAQVAQLQAQATLWQDIDRIASDTFVSIFDSGKNAFERLTDTVKNTLYKLLYEMTLKKWIINISAGVSGTGAAQAAFAGQTGAGGLGGLGGLSSGAFSLAGLSQGWGLAAANMGTAGYFGSLGANLGLAGSSLASGSFGTALGAIAPYALPAAGLAALLGGIFNSKPSGRAAWGEFNLGSASSFGVGSQTGEKYSQENNQAIQALLGMSSQVTGLIQALGGSAAGSYRLSVSDRYGYGLDVGEGGVGGYKTKDEAEFIRAVLDRILDSTTGLTDSTRALLDAASGSSEELIAVAQGMVTLRQAIPGLEATFRSLYYTQEEQNAFLRDELITTMAGLNQTLPDSKDGFRALVEGIDRTTEQGLQLYAALLDLGTPFAALIDSEQALADEAARAAQAVGTVADSLAAVAAEAWDLYGKASTIGQGYIGNLADVSSRLTGDRGAVLASQASALQAEAARWAAKASGSWNSETILARAVLAELQTELGRVNQELYRYTTLSQTYTAQQAAQIVELEKWYATAMQGAGTMTGIIDLAYQQQLDSILAVTDATTGLGDQWLSIAQGLRGYLDSLRTGSLSTLDPAGRLDSAQSAYVSTLGAALAGDIASAQSLQQYASTYLEQARAYYGSGTQYADIFSGVTGQLDQFVSAAALGGPQNSAAMMQQSLDGLPDALAAVLVPQLVEATQQGTAVDAAGYQQMTTLLAQVVDRLESIERRTLQGVTP